MGSKLEVGKLQISKYNAEEILCAAKNDAELARVGVSKRTRAKQGLSEEIRYGRRFVARVVKVVTACLPFLFDSVVALYFSCSPLRRREKGERALEVGYLKSPVSPWERRPVRLHDDRNLIV